MNFVSFSKNIAINFVMLTDTLIIIKLKTRLNHFIYIAIIAHNVTHISTTFLDSAILVTGPLISFPSMLEMFC